MAGELLVVAVPTTRRTRAEAKAGGPLDSDDARAEGAPNGSSPRSTDQAP